jgi:hypothetical protein
LSFKPALLSSSSRFAVKSNCELVKPSSISVSKDPAFVGNKWYPKKRFVLFAIVEAPSLICWRRYQQAVQSSITKHNLGINAMLPYLKEII